MKKILGISIIIIASLLGNFSCDGILEKHYELNIKNNSNTTISCYFYLVWKGGNNGVVYPDTSLLFNKQELVSIKSRDIFYTSRSIVPITDWIASLPQDTISFYFFNQDSLDKYLWAEIQQRYKVIQRYDLSSEDIIVLQNEYGVPTIPYPPTKAMKNMKMYPPYEE